ncbi:uncharacterized protein LOC120700668 [Panicum virgatum]|nr:uncharacterized protein LOC120700668 [Panicum virgatum]
MASSGDVGPANASAESSKNDGYDPLKDPRRRPKSNDPGWKYAYYVEPGKRDLIQCALCPRKIKGGIIRVKQHGRILNEMRKFTKGMDLVRMAATRFATAFLTLRSLHKHKDALRALFSGDVFTRSKVAKTEAGKKVYEIIFSTQFWNSVEDCLRASLPLLVVLRLVDGDEKPALPEVAAAMNIEKQKISASFSTQNKKACLNRIMKIVENRWVKQMDTPLYGAALYLNPGKFYKMK